MKCKLLLPYIDYYGSTFDVDENYYSNDAYEKALKSNNEMYGDSIYNHISNGGFNTNTAVFRGSYDINNIVNGFNDKVSKNEEKTLYSSCECEVFDEYMKDITINDIMEQTFNKDIFIMYIKLDFNTIEEEFEEDYKLWVRTHNNINKQKMSDDWKFENEPKRTMKLILSNKEFDLVNCKILEVSNNGLFVLIEEIKDVK